MKLIIDIPEDVIDDMKDLGFIPEQDNEELCKAIDNGTLLTEVVAKIKALDTDCHVVYAVAIDDVLQILEEYTEEYTKGAQE